jgi:hypothetical protein
MFDTTIHLGDVLVAAGFLIGAYRIAATFRDDMRDLKQTVYGSKQPPVEGLVEKVDRHERTLFPLQR